MTVKSGFFSDGSSYNQADFNAFLLDSIGSGYVLGYGLELRVIQNSPANMGVIVRTGRCYVQGYYGWVTSNEALTVPTADATNPRIDRVVARLSVSVNQSVTFAVLTGTPAANPSAPALTRTSETYEISLARIYVGAGVTSITTANITDERGDATVCGVAGVKHSWSYLNNVALDVSSMVIDAGVSDRDPVYFNGTKWVVATAGAVGFYDEANDAVITAGYLDGFTGLTPGAIVDNHGVAITATEIIVLESPVDNSGIAQYTGVLNGGVDSKYTLSQTPHALTVATVIPAYSSTASSGTFVDGLVAALASVNAINPACVIFNNQGATYPFSLDVVTTSNQPGSQTTYKTYNAAGTELSSVTVDPGAYTLSIDATVDKITYAISGGTEHTASCAALYAVFY
ncbi:MAG: hypothetical protein PHR14_10825 [Oscillospiraceae bacterium]|nr:hypothetical protein [Oscillospiraceae bacterium]